MALNLGIKPQAQEGDRLIVKDSATGGNNVLDISLLSVGQASYILPQDLVLVDAPAGTAHDYFSFASG